MAATATAVVEAVLTVVAFTATPTTVKTMANAAIPPTRPPTKAAVTPYVLIWHSFVAFIVLKKIAVITLFDAHYDLISTDSNTFENRRVKLITINAVTKIAGNIKTHCVGKQRAVDYTGEDRRVVVK